MATTPEELEFLRQQFPDLEFEDIIPQGGGLTGAPEVDQLLAAAQQPEPSEPGTEEILALLQQQDTSLSSEDEQAAQLLNTIIQQSEGARPEDTFAAVGESVVTGLEGSPGGAAGGPAQFLEPTRGSFSRSQPRAVQEDQRKVEAFKALGLDEATATAMAAGLVGTQELQGITSAQQATAGAEALRAETELGGQRFEFERETQRAATQETKAARKQARRQQATENKFKRQQIGIAQKEFKAKQRQLDIEEQKLRNNKDISLQEIGLRGRQIDAQREKDQAELDLANRQFEQESTLLGIAGPAQGGLGGTKRLRALLERGVSLPVPTRRRGISPLAPLTGRVFDETVNADLRKQLTEAGGFSQDDPIVNRLIDKATELKTNDLAQVLDSLGL